MVFSFLVPESTALGRSCRLHSIVSQNSSDPNPSNHQSCTISPTPHDPPGFQPPRPNSRLPLGLAAD
ncbi:hypothetical protein SLEP1_g45728 [Rubroshorea leprosula]|uniref:Uncharacterized protein n=1 Tax=Rubroshorea leprosula TaxID=152421 RepID=A0AAV5LJX8_9ROSI|nr:hypothetical protein SLEP1_g45728 [Rubroshorea leprosula]